MPGPFKALSRQEFAVLLMLAAGYLAMFVPAYLRLSETTWATDEQGHGPLVLAVSFWLMFRQMERMQQLASRPSHLAGIAFLVVGLLCYVAGHAQHIGLLSVGAQIPVLMGLILMFKGWAGVRLVWFGLFFLIFMMPATQRHWSQPMHTGPLKSAVSAVAAEPAVTSLGYPVGTRRA